MNDFTKEELQIIYLDMTICAKKCTPLNEAPSHLDIRNKIQSMINNYCEHAQEILSNSSCPLGSDMTYKCKKCGAYYR